MKKKKNYDVWYSSIVTGLAILAIAIMEDPESDLPRFIYPLILFAILLINSVLGLTLHKALNEAEEALSNMVVVDGTVIRNELVGKRFKRRSPDGDLSDWTDHIQDVKFIKHTLHLAGVHKNGETVSSTQLTIVGTRNQFGYTLDEIVLLN